MIKRLEFEGKTVEDAINNGLSSLGVERENIDFEIVQREHKGILGIGSKPAIIAIMVESDEPEIEEAKQEKKETKVSSNDVSDKATAFLKDLLSKMGIEASFETKVEKNEVFVNINADRKEYVIGRRGETLDAIQYLTMLAVNRECGEHHKITLDIANYRAERVETLENLARKLAAKAKKTRRNVSLEPMNAYERKIIHSALQNDKSVSTYSVGDEPNRKIVISCKPRKEQ